jgi:hypothetical protein
VKEGGRTRTLIFGAAVLLSACGQHPPEDGFAALKYGMSTEQLKPLGFDCGANDGDCDQIQPPPSLGQGTIFDKPVRLAIQTDDGKLTQINVVVPNYSDDELIAMYTEAYGKPEICRFQNALAATVERAIWSASNGATITVSKILDYGAAPDLSGLAGLSSSAAYRGPEASKKFKAGSC